METIAAKVFFFPWEETFMVWLQNFLGEKFIKAFYYVSCFGEEVVLVAILGFLYWCYDKKVGEQFGYSMLFGSLGFATLKNLARRARPYMASKAIQCFKPVNSSADIMDITAQGYSFPSGHSTNSACVYGTIGYVFRKKWSQILAVLLPLLVGIARVALGNHYPTDVLCGWALGYSGVFLIPWIMKRVKNRKKAYLIAFLIVSCGCFFCRSNDFFTGYGMMAGVFLSVLYEQKYVNFKPTRKPLYCILRVTCGAGIYAVLNTLMKLPFSEEFLESASAGQFAFRFIRYTVIIFICIGIYPKVFAPFEAWAERKKHERP